MREYEYSFNVESLHPYMEYCQNNNYTMRSHADQERTIYRGPNKTIARVTVNVSDDVETKTLDFKDDVINDEVLIERKETLPLSINDTYAVSSVLDFLGYKKDVTLVRTRVVYEKGGVKFEFDSYTQPKKAYVVAIEGDKDKVDLIYNEIKNSFGMQDLG